MGIIYKDIKSFEPKDLEELFLSVKWSSGEYPDKLKIAMENSHSVFSAWDGEKLIGLINCLSDGAMTAYVHYLLVNPEYQGLDIGKNLVDLILEKYKDYPKKILISYDYGVGFYKKCGFEVDEGTTAMVQTILTT